MSDDNKKAPPAALQRAADEISAYIKARAPIVVVQTAEETRAENMVCEVAVQLGYDIRRWCEVTGVVGLLGKDGKDRDVQLADPKGAPVVGSTVKRPDAVLGALRVDASRAVWILRDLPSFFSSSMIVRMVRTLARELPRDGVLKTAVILTPRSDFPPELKDVLRVVKLDLPDRPEIGRIVDAVIAAQAPPASDSQPPANWTRSREEWRKFVADKRRVYERAAASPRDACVEAAVGLTAAGAGVCFTKSIVTQGGAIEPKVVAEEKRRVIADSHGLEWIVPDPRGLAAVAGYRPLKEWFAMVKGAFTPEAREFGLDPPRGVLFVGAPGCGKSLFAKALATAWGWPLLRMDVGAMMGSLVGQSEERMRGALASADAIGRCIIWLDEMEKGFSGARGEGDSGVGKRTFGYFLTWMQEHAPGPFVAGTANDVTSLPPELLRKGRFDEVWAIDLPTCAERAEIVRVTLAKAGRGDAPVDAERIAALTPGYSGAEIAAAFEKDALYAAFNDGRRQVVTEDMVRAVKRIVPLSRTAAEQVNKLRDWIKEGRARAASDPEVEVEVTGGSSVAGAATVDASAVFPPGFVAPGEN